MKHTSAWPAQPLPALYLPFPLTLPLIWYVASLPRRLPDLQLYPHLPGYPNLLDTFNARSQTHNLLPSHPLLRKKTLLLSQYNRGSTGFRYITNQAPKQGGLVLWNNNGLHKTFQLASVITCHLTVCMQNHPQLVSDDWDRVKKCHVGLLRHVVGDPLRVVGDPLCVVGDPLV